MAWAHYWSIFAQTIWVDISVLPPRNLATSWSFAEPSMASLVKSGCLLRFDADQHERHSRNTATVPDDVIEFTLIITRTRRHV
jgi:hypothetical protein